jgi:hypothetical protein
MVIHQNATRRVGEVISLQYILYTSIVSSRSPIHLQQRLNICRCKYAAIHDDCSCIVVSFAKVDSRRLSLLSYVLNPLLNLWCC